MKKLQVFAASAVLSAMSLSAHAESYWSANYSSIDVDGNATLGAVNLAYGMPINDLVTIEGNIGFGVGDDTTASNTTLELGTAYGVAAIAGTEISDGLTAFGKLAYNSVEVDFDDPTGGSGSFDDAGIGFGAGLIYGLSTGSIIGQYQSLVDEDDLEGVTAISIGYQMEI